MMTPQHNPAGDKPRGITRRLFRHALSVAVAATLVCSMPLAMAQAYPSKVVKIIVPFPPGAATDNMARALALRLQTALGQPFIVENKAGASGILGTQFVAQSPADGHTLLYTASGPISTALKLYDKVPYDADRDLVPVSLFIANTVVVTGRPGAAQKDFPGYLKYARENPGKLKYGFGPAGGLPHLLMANFAQQTKVDLTFVPYKGGAPVLVDMIGGTLDIATGNLSEVNEQLKAGKIVPLAVASRERSPVLPDTPTLVELGYPDMVAEAWSALLAPAGTPEPVIRKLNEEMRKIQRDPAFMADVARQAAVIKPSTPDEARRFIRAETVKWSKVVSDNNIKAD